MTASTIVGEPAAGRFADADAGLVSPLGGVAAAAVIVVEAAPPGESAAYTGRHRATDIPTTVRRIDDRVGVHAPLGVSAA